VLLFGVHKDADTLQLILDPATFAGLVFSVAVQSVRAAERPEVTSVGLLPLDVESKGIDGPVTTARHQPLGVGNT
jgi:hypothetical protein